jgi:3-phosphoshikimate 1-carboxyvinyltransferase
MKQRPDWTLALPGSKSITNRVFLCAALAKGKSRIFGALKSDDSDVMLHALKDLGVKINERKDFIEISGTDGRFKPGKITLDLHNAGTAVRFLTSAMILRKGETIITGDKRMQERPIEDLVDGLKQLGASIEYLGENGCPPLLIKDLRLTINEKPKIGNRKSEIVIKMRGDKSSQYFSALLMLGPCLKKPLKIEVIGELVSKPYIDVTLDVLRQFGIKVQNNDYKTFVVRSQAYKAVNYTIEGDATSASYWTSIAYLHGGKVRFLNLNDRSLQGDAKYKEVLKHMTNVDMASMPDTAMTLAVTAPFVKGQTKITGLSTLRIKETDRIKALETELKKIGVKVKTTKDSIIIYPIEGPIAGPIEGPIVTYNDHRMAMCFAVLGTMTPGIIIENPKCTEKTYPDFWKDLELAYLNPIKLGQKNLVLTGMRCSGKNHLGKRIAHLLKREFIDLDMEIERSANMQIQDIVKSHGWPYFRKLEQKMCSQVSNRKNLVIATGGGVILDEKNMKNLKKNGINIFIFAGLPVIIERIKTHSKNRPALTCKGGVREIKDIWKERRDLYIKYADIIWDNTSGEIVKNNLDRIFP